MGEGQPVHPSTEDDGKWLMDLLVGLLEDQTGEKYEYQRDFFTKGDKCVKIRLKKQRP